MRVVLLMNFIAPYRVKLLETLHRRAGQLDVWLSTRMEHDRAWAPEWGSLRVAVQRTITFRKRHVYGSTFDRELEIHVPYDTLPRLVAHRPDAVIAGELGSRSLQAALYRLVRPRMPLLIWATLSEHSEASWGPVRRTLRRFILRVADGVLVNGESGARYIRRFGVSDERIFRVNQPVDVALFTAEPSARRDDGVTRVLVSGMLIKRKGVDLLDAALRRWAAANPDRSLEITYVGDGPLSDMLGAAGGPSNLRNRLLGHRSYAELPPIYAAADLFVFPTLLDEWGLVVNEAMASGLPVLGSRYSQAVEELVAEGVTGWIFDPLDPADLQRALDRALGTPRSTLDAMGEAGRRRIAALTPESAAERIAGALQATRERLRPASVPQPAAWRRSEP